LGFLQIDQRAADALREIAPLVRDALPGVLAEFYTHVRKWPHTSGMFSGEPMMNMAKNKQIEPWNIILRGDFSSDYVDSVRRIGRTHARIGLEPRWYIAAYSFMIRRVTTLIAADCHAKVFRGGKVKPNSKSNADYAAAVHLYSGAFQNAAGIGSADRVAKWEGSTSTWETMGGAM
jgi:methyl-accepting chemotaxis protein